VVQVPFEIIEMSPLVNCPDHFFYPISLKTFSPEEGKESSLVTSHPKPYGVPSKIRLASFRRLPRRPVLFLIKGSAYAAFFRRGPRHDVPFPSRNQVFSKTATSHTPPFGLE